MLFALPSLNFLISRSCLNNDKLNDDTNQENKNKPTNDEEECDELIDFLIYHYHNNQDVVSIEVCTKYTTYFLTRKTKYNYNKNVFNTTMKQYGMIKVLDAFLTLKLIILLHFFHQRYSLVYPDSIIWMN